MPLANVHCLEFINPDNTHSTDPSYKLYDTTIPMRVQVRCAGRVRNRQSPLYHVYMVHASQKYVIERNGNIVREFSFPHYFEVK
ncbi:hypothetical protein ID866_11923 [Astraeus odoratus]|nr:hypothetical protein ID866_11923 [Astraeus odoratus]